MASADSAIELVEPVCTPRRIRFSVHTSIVQIVDELLVRPSAVDILRTEKEIFTDRRTAVSTS